MRGLTVTFAILCLAYASGAPTAEVPITDLLSRTFKFDNKDIVFAEMPFAKNEAVYGACEGSGIDKKCKIYREISIETADGETSTIQSCDLELKYNSRSDYQLLNAGNSKVVFALKDGETKIKLISVNLKGCVIKEASIEITKTPSGYYNDPIDINLVGHENDYDVIFRNTKLCSDYLCKATFGYDGKVVTPVSSFPVKDIDGAYYKVVSSSNFYVVDEGRYVNSSTNVYLIDKDQKSSTLFSGKESRFGLSTAENKAGFCVHSEQKEVCKQYDSDGKTKIFEVEIKTGEGYVDAISVLNLENGLLVLNNGRVDDRKQTFLVRFDEQGKQQKYINIDMKCGYMEPMVPQLYKSSSGEYCVTSFCCSFLDLGDNHPDHEFTRNSRCFLHSELF